MKTANRRLGHIFAGAHLDEWLSYGPRLMEIRQHAMQVAHTNNVKDHFYKQLFRGALKRLLPKFIDEDGQSVGEQATFLLWVEEPERRAILDDYRPGLSAGMHANFSTPKAAYTAVSRIIKARDAEARALGAKPDAAPADDAQQAVAAALGDEEPTVSEKQFVSAFQKWGASQIALMLIAANQDHANDLADRIKIEIKVARQDAKDAARRARERFEKHG
jgi:hypothetical protein